MEFDIIEHNQSLIFQRRLRAATEDGAIAVCRFQQPCALGRHAVSIRFHEPEGVAEVDILTRPIVGIERNNDLHASTVSSDAEVRNGAFAEVHAPLLRASRRNVMIFKGDEIDPISPFGIDHSIDEMWADDQRNVLEQRYNFLDYHFEKGGRYCRARAYLDEPKTVTLYGPFVSRGSIERVADAEFVDAVATYLRRRFRTVRTF